MGIAAVEASSQANGFPPIPIRGSVPSRSPGAPPVYAPQRADTVSLSLNAPPFGERVVRIGAYGAYMCNQGVTHNWYTHLWIGSIYNLDVRTRGGA